MGKEKVVKVSKKAAPKEILSVQELLKKFSLDTSYLNSTQIVAGVDPSLQATGVIICNGKGEILLEKLIKTKKLKGIPRLKFIRDEVLSVLKEYKVTKVAIEGYSFGSRGRATFSLGELGGVLRLALLDNKYEYFDVPPSSLKAFIADNGAADKVMMRESVRIKYNLDISEDNICDAFSLSRMCLVLGDAMPKFCTKGATANLKKVRERLLEDHNYLLQ